MFILRELDNTVYIYQYIYNMTLISTLLHASTRIYFIYRETHITLLYIILVICEN